MATPSGWRYPKRERGPDFLRRVPFGPAWRTSLEIQEDYIIEIRALVPERFSGLTSRDLVATRARFGNPVTTLALEALRDRLKAERAAAAHSAPDGAEGDQSTLGI